MAARQSPSKTAQFELANRLFFRLYQCSNLVHKKGTRYVTAFGATTQQWAVLGALAHPLVRIRGMTIKELIEFLMVSRQNLTVVLDRLEARGWVERIKDNDDGRSRRIRLTAAGRRTWARMQGAIETFYGDVLDGFSDRDRSQLSQWLDRLKDALNRV
jgi:DNA-binding MarR family transcriptional regulator